MILLLKYWKYILGAAVLSYVLFSVYNNIYDRGYNAKAVEIEKLRKQQAEDITKLAKAVSDNSDRIAQQASQNAANILLLSKGKPMYIVDKSGKCSLSNDFETAYKGLLK